MGIVKVVGFLGSPRKDGNTATILSHVLSAAAEYYAEVETVFLHGIHLSPCQGCYRCEATGKCVIRDGMVVLYEKLRACDAVVLASPIYFHHVTAQMKLFLDRLYALIDVRNGRKSRLSAHRKSAVVLTYENEGRERYAGVARDIEMILNRFHFDVVGTVMGCGLAREAALNIPTEIIQKAGEVGAALVTGTVR